MINDGEFDDDYLVEFKGYLENTGISPNTVRYHVNDINFYLSYLYWEGAKSAAEGIGEYYVSNYFDYFLLHKVINSSLTFMRTCGTSLRKYYKFLLDLGKVSEKDYKDMCTLISEGMPQWLAQYKDYNRMMREEMLGGDYY